MFPAPIRLSIPNCTSIGPAVFGRPLQVTVHATLWDRCLSCLSICNAGVLWLHGSMDQDTTWYGGLCLGPDDIVLDGDPPASHGKGHSSPHFRILAHVYCGKRSPISATAELLLHRSRWRVPILNKVCFLTRLNRD